MRARSSCARLSLDDSDLAGQTLYVWFEMAARYFAYAEHVNEGSGAAGDYGRFWRSDDASIVQFFGVDNNFYYALLLPALYLAFDAERDISGVGGRTAALRLSRVGRPPGLCRLVRIAVGCR